MKIAGRSPWEKANDDVPSFAFASRVCGWKEKAGCQGSLKGTDIKTESNNTISNIMKLNTETNQSNETYFYSALGSFAFKQVLLVLGSS